MSATRHSVVRVLVTGAGTVGHSYPVLTTIRPLQDRLAGSGRRAQLLWVGVAHGLGRSPAKLSSPPGSPPPGALAAATGIRTAIDILSILLLATAVLLPWPLTQASATDPSIRSKEDAAA